MKVPDAVASGTVSAMDAVADDPPPSSPPSSPLSRRGVDARILCRYLWIVAAARGGAEEEGCHPERPSCARVGPIGLGSGQCLVAVVGVYLHLGTRCPCYQPTVNW